MNQERPMPRYPLGRATIIILVFIAVAAVNVWLAVRFDSAVSLGALLFAVAVIAYFYYHHRRCPECRTRLRVRHDYIRGSQHFRLLLDCPRCQIAWDTGQIGDESTSG
jgi:hypothetical protein